MVQEKVEDVMEWIHGLENGFDSVFNYRPLNQLTTAKSHMFQCLAIIAFWYDILIVATKLRELPSWAEHNLSQYPPKHWQQMEGEKKPQHKILNTTQQELGIARALKWVCPTFP